MPSSDRVVLFADMLGFAKLIEKYPIDIDGLTVCDKPLSLSLDRFFRKSQNLLSDAFSSFHYSLKWAIMMAKMRHPITAITFSDSVFIATNYLFEAVKISVELVQSLMSQKVPIRVGIAYGSFAALTFRSDISLEGGDHASQFLGTSVVRAHLAESCGIKGIRILLHPSIMPLLEDETHNPTTNSGVSKAICIFECSEKEQINRTSIQHEVDYWNLPISAKTKAWKGLQEMWDMAPSNEAEHYLATAEAINRMRIAQGEQSLNNLRRRTLPRRSNI